MFRSVEFIALLVLLVFFDSNAKAAINTEDINNKSSLNSMQLEKKQYDIALVLSGGDINSAFYHIGVLKEIEKYKIPIDLICASSWGSIVAGLWSYGYSAQEIENIFIGDSLFKKLIDQNIPESLILNSQKKYYDNTYYLMDKTRGVNFGVKLERIDDQWRKYDYATNKNSDLKSQLNIELKPYFVNTNDQKLRASLKIAVSNKKTNEVTILEKGDVLQNILSSLPLKVSNYSEFYNANVMGFLPVKELKDKYKIENVIASNAISRMVNSNHDESKKDILERLNRKQVEEQLLDSSIIHVQLYRSVNDQKAKLIDDKVKLVVKNGQMALREKISLIGKKMTRARNYNNEKKDLLELNSTPTLDLAFDNVDASVQEHLRAFWNSSEHSSNGSKYQVLDQIKKSDLYSNIEIEVPIKENDGSEKVILTAKPKVNSDLYMGVLGQTDLGMGASFGGRVNFVNQLEFNLGIEGFYALNFYGFGAKLNISRNSYYGLFIDLNTNLTFKDNSVFYKDLNITDPQIISTTNYKISSVNIGFNRGDSLLFYGTFKFDFSQYNTGTMAYYNNITINDSTNIFSDYYKDVSVRSLNLALTYSSNEQRVADPFLRDGYGYLITEAAVANAVPNLFNSQSDLYSRTRVAFRAAASKNMLSINYKADAALDVKFEGNKMVLPDSLDLLAKKVQDPGLDRIYQNNTNASIYGQSYPMMEYYAHRYILQSISLGLNYQGSGLWLINSYLYNPDGGNDDEYFMINKHLQIVEILARLKHKSFEVLVGAEQNSYRAELSEGWKSLKDWRYYVRVGQLNF